MNNDIKRNKIIDPMSFDDISPYSNKKENKPIQPMVFDVPTKSFEDKIYIILLVGDGNDSLFDGQFKICNGRTECYRHIERLIEAFGTDLDVFESKVITETKQTEAETGNGKYYLVNLKDAVSVYAFCKSVENYYTNESFSIDNYFSPPNVSIEESSVITEKEVFAYTGSIEDDIVAQAAAETFKEMAAARGQIFAYNVSQWEKNGSSDIKQPMLFDDDDGSRNV